MIGLGCCQMSKLLRIIRSNHFISFISVWPEWRIMNLLLHFWFIVPYWRWYSSNRNAMLCKHTNNSFKCLTVPAEQENERWTVLDREISQHWLSPCSRPEPAKAHLHSSTTSYPEKNKHKHIAHYPAYINTASKALLLLFWQIFTFPFDFVTA